MKTKTILFNFIASFIASFITLGITFAQNNSPVGTVGMLIGISIPVLGFALVIWLFIFWVQMLIDVIKYQEKDKAIWVIVIILGNSIGAIVYYFAAKKPRLAAAMLINQGPIVQPTTTTQTPAINKAPTTNPFS